MEKTGIVLVTAAVFVVFLTFAPAIKEEAKYRLDRNRSNATPVLSRSERLTVVSDTTPRTLVPIDEEFGIVIPKIEANAKVVADVDWQDASVYQRALTKGVAHAAGTARPGEGNNIFIFAHSGVDFYEAARYNAVFYLMNKLEEGDLVYLFSRGEKYRYAVAEKRLVDSDAVEYLEDTAPGETLTLMTCWPPGTTLKRLIVRAHRAPDL